jgi:protein-arginine kinase activator protein McsA
VALDFINSLNGETINLFRTKDTKVKTSVSRVKKYICPNCGTKVKATKEVNIICADCSTDFQQEEGEE